MSIRPLDSSSNSYSEPAAAAAYSRSSTRAPSPLSEPGDTVSERSIWAMMSALLAQQKLMALKLADTETLVTTLTGTVTQLQTDVATEKTRVVKLTQDIATEKLTSSGLTTSVAQLTKDVVAEKAKVVKLTQDVAAEKLTSSGLSTSVAQLTKDVAAEKAKVVKLTQDVAAEKLISAGLTTRVTQLIKDVTTEKTKVVKLTQDVAAEKLISAGLSTNVAQLTKDVAAEKTKVKLLTNEKQNHLKHTKLLTSTISSLKESMKQKEYDWARKEAELKGELKAHFKLWDKEASHEQNVRAIISYYAYGCPLSLCRNHREEARAVLQDSNDLESLLSGIDSIEIINPTGLLSQCKKFIKLMLAGKLTPVAPAEAEPTAEPSSSENPFELT